MDTASLALGEAAAVAAGLASAGVERSKRMNRLVRWLDGLVERLCNWLNDRVSGKRRLALLGDGLAGVQSGTPLPVDRRIDPGILEMHENRYEMGNSSQAKAGSHPSESACGFWAYCHLGGKLCVRCGGKNLLGGYASGIDFNQIGEELCPSGFDAGTAWYGCCKDPYGKGKLIAFLDCCGLHIIPCTWGHHCSNWPEAKNWCVFGPPRTEWYDGRDHPFYGADQTEEYYCTVVINMNADASCN